MSCKLLATARAPEVPISLVLSCTLRMTQAGASALATYQNCKVFFPGQQAKRVIANDNNNNDKRRARGKLLQLQGQAETSAEKQEAIC